MPLYEYVCEACGEHCELLQKFSDAPATQCPSCNADTLQKQISATSFHLKGSGWYVTDFRDKKSQSDTKSVTKEEATKKVAPTEAKKETKTDKE